MRKVSRNDNSVMQIKLAFFGATKNIYLLQEALLQNKKIPLYQYSNYLSQVAFCIELGLKNIIINTDDFDCKHDIPFLFSKAPTEFQQKLKSLYPNDINLVEKMENLKEIFVDFRYMKLESVLNEYFEGSIINSDNTINFEKAMSLPNYQFLHIFLDNIIDYERNIREETLRSMQNIDFSSIDNIIKGYIETLKNVP